jgi:hypothetical protein
MGEEVGEGESFGCCRRPFIILSEAIIELLLNDQLLAQLIRGIVESVMFGEIGRGEITS